MWLSIMLDLSILYKGNVLVFRSPVAGMLDYVLTLKRSQS